MYQLNYTLGYQLRVGREDSAVFDGAIEKFRGTYNECMMWLEERKARAIG